MPEFTKAQRKVLRELAAQVYEADARVVLGQLENDFVRWRADEMGSSELLEAIHQFHQVQSRELWSRYQSLKDPEIVARGIAFGLLSPTKLPEALVAELATLIDLFARHKG